MFSLDDATTYLLSSGLIDCGWVIDGELTIRGSARRHRNFRVEGPGGGYFIKQADDHGAIDRATLGVEAAFYRFCQEELGVRAMSRIIPQMVHYDPGRSLLGSRLIPEAKPLWAFLRDRDRPLDSAGAAGALGHALGTVHETFSQPGLIRDPRLAALGSALPWILTVHRPCPDMLAGLGAANLEAIRILQTEDGLPGRLDDLAGNWRLETVIHGDIKLDNVLAWESQDRSGWEVRIVDWEMARLGDPAWDLAGALQGFVVSWVDSMPFEADLALEDRVERAAYPLGTMQEAIRSLWGGYRAATEAGPRACEERLDRAVELAAPRMIQTALELSWDAPEPLPRAVLLLQLAANVLSAPHIARTQLFGVPAPLLPG
jgi:phosphotransferase family enzyme